MSDPRHHFSAYHLSDLFQLTFGGPLVAALRLRPNRWARRILTERVSNLHQVDERLYRSAQPTADGMQALASFGVERVLSLRQFHHNDDACVGTTLESLHVQMTADIHHEHVVEALRLILASPRPILVHCFHGADRTGVVVALYRILVQGWGRRQALHEMLYGGYGFRRYQSAAERYVRGLSRRDLQQMRRQLAL